MSTTTDTPVVFLPEGANTRELNEQGETVDLLTDAIHAAFSPLCKYLDQEEYAGDDLNVEIAGSLIAHAKRRVLQIAEDLESSLGRIVIKSDEGVHSYHSPGVLKALYLVNSPLAPANKEAA